MKVLRIFASAALLIWSGPASAKLATATNSPSCETNSISAPIAPFLLQTGKAVCAVGFPSSLPAFQNKDPEAGSEIKLSSDEATKQILALHEMGPSARALLQRLARSANEANDISEVKPLYEKEWERILNENSKQKREILYNRQSVKLSEVLKEGKLQCHSGTLLFALVVNELRKTKPWIADDVVMISEPQHSLPGFLVRKEGELELVGIESTSGGKALKRYGSLKELIAKADGKTHVVSLDDFLFAEAAKYDLQNPKEVAERLQARFLARNGFSQEKIQSFLGGLTHSKEKASSDPICPPLNWSILGIPGDERIPEGDQVRSNAEALPPGQVHSAGAWTDSSELMEKLKSRLPASIMKLIPGIIANEKAGKYGRFINLDDKDDPAAVLANFRTTDPSIQLGLLELNEHSSDMVGDSAMHALAWSDGTDKVLALNELAYQQLKRGRARVRRSALSHLATNAAEDSRTLEAIRENMLSPDPEMRLWSLEYAYLLPKQEVLERSIKVLEDLKIDPQDRGKHIETYLIVLSSFTDGAPAWFTQKIKALASQEKDPTAKPIYDSLVDRFRRNELRRAQDEHDRIFGRDP